MMEEELAIAWHAAHDDAAVTPLSTQSPQLLAGAATYVPHLHFWQKQAGSSRLDIWGVIGRLRNTYPGLCVVQLTSDW
jgi:hypothetical protein